MNENRQKTIETFNRGGIVIFPTDTAFGIGCRVDKVDTIERLYSIRKRPVTQPMSLLVDGVEMAKRYVQNIPEDVLEKLIKNYWPGGLTIVLLAKKEMVPSQIRANGETIGVRMPDHKALLSVISKVGVPILGPSANFHGEKTPFVLSDLNPTLLHQVDYVMEGVCKGQSASTVIDCTIFPWKIIRQGAVTL